MTFHQASTQPDQDSRTAELIHIRLVAERLGLSEYQMRGLVERGVLPSTKVGNRTYIPTTAVDAYLESIGAAS